MTKKIWYAIFEINPSVYDEREKSIKLDGVFGTVFAPKSKCVVEQVTRTMTILIPCWVFWNKDQNPCQFDGYVKTIHIDK